MPTRQLYADGFSARCLTGEPRVVAAIWNEYRVPFAQRLRERFRPGLAPDECEEIVSLALGRAWEHRTEFVPASGSFEAWFWGITLHLAIEIIRKPWSKERAREIVVPPETLFGVASAAVVTPRDEAATEAADDDIDLVRLALAALPEIRRDILLADANSPTGIVSSRDLGPELGVAPSTIRWHRAQGKAQLKDELIHLGYRCASGEAG